MELFQLKWWCIPLSMYSWFLWFTGCGKTLTDSSGTISFLTSKIPILEPKTCVWRVFWTAGEGLHLRLKYVNFKFGCKRAYLEIRDGKHAKSELVGRYCKDNPPPKAINLSNSSLWLKFHYGYRYYLPKRNPVGFIAEYTGKLTVYRSCYLCLFA